MNVSRRTVLPTLLGLVAFATTTKASAQTITPKASQLKVATKEVLPYVGADGKLGTYYVEHTVYHL